MTERVEGARARLPSVVDIIAMASLEGQRPLAVLRGGRDGKRFGPRSPGRVDARSSCSADLPGCTTWP